jgi:ABC-2 type transport system permease protein
VVTALVASLAAGLGVAIAGDDPTTPFVGVFVLALYATATAGIGLAFGGLLRASWAAVVAAVAVVAGLMIEILVPAFDLPVWVRDFALSSHYGEPLVGNWDWVGIAASLVLAFGGLAVGAWGFSRRDLKG